MKTLAAAVLFAVALTPALSAQTDPFTGKWEGAINFLRPNGTTGDSDPIVFNITQKGNELTGTCGSGREQWTIEKGVVNAGTATFDVQQPNGPLLKFTLSVNQGKLQGEARLVRAEVVRATATVEATKGKEAVPSTPAQAQVVRVGDLNTRQIRALDRNKTVVFLQGGMLEEHGPYLPAFTDGILSARLTDAVASGIAKDLPGWTVLRFPVISVGASGSNRGGSMLSVER